MVRCFIYNIYTPERTRPHSVSEAHWKNMGVKLGMQMRKVPADPAHKIDPLLMYSMRVRERQGGETRMASLTPQSP